jgi:hypothetical protein
MSLKRAIQLTCHAAFLAGCSYCPPSLRGAAAVKPEPSKLVDKDGIEPGLTL